jgi:hypothetical protein
MKKHKWIKKEDNVYKIIDNKIVFNNKVCKNCGLEKAEMVFKNFLRKQSGGLAPNTFYTYKRTIYFITDKVGNIIEGSKGEITKVPYECISEWKNESKDLFEI